MILNFIFFVVLAIQILFYIFLYRNFFTKRNVNVQYKPPVSIVICAKNEAKNLLKNIPAIAEQNYPTFEIIIVDDQSTDETKDVVSLLKKKYTNINYLYIENKIGFGKKNIIEKGVAIAVFDTLLFTDADCKPASPNWIATLTSHLLGHDIVLGISPYYATKNSILLDMQQYETIQTYLQYIALANAGMPYMCVGRNVMIKKALYQQLKWKNEEYHLATGDDDLMIQKLANATNTNTCIDKDSFTFSWAKDTYTDWSKQKLRHYTAGISYKFIHQFILGTFLWTKLLFYILAMYLFCIKTNYLILILVTTYFSMLFLLFNKISNNYQNKLSILKISYLDFLTTFNILLLSFLSLFKNKKNKW